VVVLDPRTGKLVQIRVPPRPQPKPAPKGTKVGKQLSPPSAAVPRKGTSGRSGLTAQPNLTLWT
jgi:hypothetical protein